MDVSIHKEQRSKNADASSLLAAEQPAPLGTELSTSAGQSEDKNCYIRIIEYIGQIAPRRARYKGGASLFSTRIARWREPGTTQARI